MRDRLTIQEIRSRTYKTRDAWWTVLLVDPLAARLVQLVAPYRSITPNRLTFLAFALGLGSAACFLRADTTGLIAGALLFHLSFVVDCMDGKIARLNGTGSVFGVWLDFTLDQVRVVICTIALMAGQYAASSDVRYLAMAGAILVLDMFRYLNAWQISKVKNAMRAAVALRRGQPAAFVEELVDEQPIGAADVDEVDVAALDVNREFRSKFTTFVRVRNYLIRHRIRIHLISGIEFQMAAFVVGPIVGALVAAPAVMVVPGVAGSLLLAFELLLIYKMWLSTRAFDRDMAKLDAAASIPAQRGADDGVVPDQRGADDAIVPAQRSSDDPTVAAPTG